MSVVGNRRGGNPVTLNLDKSCTRLNRVAFTEKKFQEGWLQDLIETNPEILPIDDIEPAFCGFRRNKPLISLQSGRVHGQSGQVRCAVE